MSIFRRLIAPNVQKKVFLSGGATATSAAASQVNRQKTRHRGWFSKQADRLSKNWRAASGQVSFVFVLHHGKCS